MQRKVYAVVTYREADNRPAEMSGFDIFGKERDAVEFQSKLNAQFALDDDLRGKYNARVLTRYVV